MINRNSAVFTEQDVFPIHDYDNYENTASAKVLEQIMAVFDPDRSIRELPSSKGKSSKVMTVLDYISEYAARYDLAVPT